MKKILFLLLVTISSYGQTLTNPTFGNTTTNTLTLKSNIESVSGSNKIQVQETDGKVNYLQSINIPIPFTPVNYAPSTPTLGAHLVAIDTRLGQIGNTTAGITNRIYFTGDNVTVTAGTFFASNGTGKGTATSGIPTPLVNGDNQKQYFTKDVISIAQPSATTAPPGNYSGQLTVTSSPTPNGTQQRYTIEIYKTNNGGTPIASGITGAPTGNLGVTVVAILDSGLINLVAGAITNISLNGNLASTLSLATGERLRYHVSGQKVGTGGGNVTMSVFYGSDYNSFYDVTVSQKTSTVINDSGVAGLTASDALNTLNTLKANDANVIHKTGGLNETADGIKTFDNIKLKTQPIGSNLYKIRQDMAFDDWWSIYGEGASSEKGIMVLEVGDNGEPFSALGQKFSFRYNASSSGVAKTVFEIDYNDIYSYNNILVGTSSNAGIGKVQIDNGGYYAKTGMQTNTINTANNSLTLDSADGRIHFGQLAGGIGYGNFIQSSTTADIVSTSVPLTINPFGGNTYINQDTGTAIVGAASADGVNKVIVAGTVKASPATSSDQLATLGQVNAVASSGAYTPTLTNTTNVSGSTLSNAYYTRIGDIVTVYIGVSTNVTLTSIRSTITFTLPINRTGGFYINTLVGSGGAAGNLFTNSVPSFYRLLNNEVAIDFVPVATGAYTLIGSFAYKITTP